MTEEISTLEMLEECVDEIPDHVLEMPLKFVASVLSKNNRILKAAILQNGGEVVISADSVYEMLTASKHVVAVANDDGSISVTLAPMNATSDTDWMWV